MSRDADQIAALLAEYEPQVGRAFREAMQNLRDGVDFAALVRALEVGDIEAALAAMDLSPADLQRFEMTVASAYQAAGAVAAASIPQIAPRLKFNMRMPGAEMFLRDFAAEKVTRTISEQREMIRDALGENIRRGQNPRAAALEITGRIDPLTKRRTGGIIGLSAPQEATMRTIRAGLASGDPATLRHYLSLKRRDGRSVRVVLRALKESKPLAKADADLLLERLSNSYLKLRGEVVARTETLGAVSAARHEALAQGMAGSGLDEAVLVRTWRSAHDSRVRHSHSAMLVREVRGLETPFVTGNGHRMRFPGDRRFGAPASDVIQCRCVVTSRLKPL